MLKKLHNFQKEGASFLATHPHALLADQPGLGKTVQAIAAVEQVGAKKILIVAPASVRLNWHKEIRESFSPAPSCEWTITSYNMAAMCAVENPKKYWDVIILDEAHFLKTPDSQRTQAIFGNEKGLARRAVRKWALTGTPVLNRPRELYPLLKTLAPGFADLSFAAFAQRYCGAYFDGRGINTRGASNLPELASKLEGFMLRRTKKEAFPGRTAPLVSRVPLNVTSEELGAVYEEEREISKRERKLSSVHEDFSQLGDLSRLLRLTGLAKVQAVCRFVEDTLESAEKVVVFAYHREVIAQLERRFHERGLGPVVLHGGMSDGQKKESVEVFARHGPGCRVFIGQRTAAGTGINGLQSVCSTAVIAEPSWVPGETEQMIDRLDRMGQKDDLVTAYILYAPGTVEEAIVAVHDSKEKTVEKLMGDELRGDLFR